MPTLDVGRAQARALRLLTVRGRSETELRKRLGQAGFEESVIDVTVEWCRRLGYVDDAQFAADWVAYRILHCPSGRRRLEKELRERGVAGALIGQILDKALPLGTERQLCLETATRRARRLDGLEPEARQRRLASFLQRRGFDYDDIRYALSEVDMVSDSE